MDRLPLRVRVTAGFALTALTVLLGLGVFLYVRVDASLTEQSREALTARLETLAQLPADERNEAVRGLTGRSFGQVLSTDGDVTASSPQLDGPLVGTDRLAGAGDSTAFVEQDVWLAAEDEAEASLLALRTVAGDHLVVGSSQEVAEDALAGLLTQLAIGIPLAVALASAVGYAVAGAALRPMEGMRRGAAMITATSSGDRLPLPRTDDEVRRLGLTLNDMLDRLEAGWQRERRLYAEAGHELRTPLALLRMELDLALSRPRTHDELLAALRSTSEEVDRLSRLSEDLLSRSRSGGDAPLRATEVDVGSLLTAVRDRFAPAAAVSGRQVVLRLEGSLPVDGDATRLDRAFTNLVDNALRHGTGDVELAGEAVDGRVVVRVADGGPATPGERGHGFGLAIAEEVAREHGGSLRVGAGGATTPTVVRLELPRSARPRPTV
jgi:signal transduction histidine kinase